MSKRISMIQDDISPFVRIWSSVSPEQGPTQFGCLDNQTPAVHCCQIVHRVDDLFRPFNLFSSLRHWFPNKVVVKTSKLDLTKSRNFRLPAKGIEWRQLLNTSIESRMPILMVFVGLDLVINSVVACLRARYLITLNIYRSRIK